MISIHALLAESDYRAPPYNLMIHHFYPRSPCGERLFLLYGVLFGCIFLSTLSLRRATGFGLARLVACINFYPRSPCGERLLKVFLTFLPIRISIHALLAESDKIPYQRQIDQKNFYPRSPCGERPLLMCFWLFGRLFLSTLSLRRATGRQQRY